MTKAVNMFLMSIGFWDKMLIFSLGSWVENVLHCHFFAEPLGLVSRETRAGVTCCTKYHTQLHQISKTETWTAGGTNKPWLSTEIANWQYVDSRLWFWPGSTSFTTASPNTFIFRWNLFLILVTSLTIRPYHSMKHSWNFTQSSQSTGTIHHELFKINRLL